VKRALYLKARQALWDSSRTVIFSLEGVNMKALIVPILKEIGKRLLLVAIAEGSRVLIKELGSGQGSKQDLGWPLRPA
jgi:hypothetical protein